MYQQLTPKQNRKSHGFEPEYNVDGIITVGTYTPDKWINMVESDLRDKHIEFKKSKLKGFLRNVPEFKIEKKTFWLMTTLGSAELASVVHLGCQFGSKINLHLGSCGGLDPNLKDYTTIIPISSYDTGTSATMYSDGRSTNVFYPDHSLSEILLQLCKNTGLTSVKGKIITCQAMYAQTENDIQTWSEQDFSGVEMETATLFAVSNYFEVPAGAMVYITDNLIKGDTVLDNKHAKSAEFRKSIKNRFVAVSLNLILSGFTATARFSTSA